MAQMLPPKYEEDVITH